MSRMALLGTTSGGTHTISHVAGLRVDQIIAGDHRVGRDRRTGTGTAIQPAGSVGLDSPEASFPRSITLVTPSSATVPAPPTTIATRASSTVRHSGRRRVLGLMGRMVLSLSWCSIKYTLRIPGLRGAVAMLLKHLAAINRLGRNQAAIGPHATLAAAAAELRNGVLLRPSGPRLLRAQAIRPAVGAEAEGGLPCRRVIRRIDRHPDVVGEPRRRSSATADSPTGERRSSWPIGSRS